MLNQLEPHDLAELEKSCCEAAQLGGAILKKWLGKTTPKSKGDRDWVTQADLESQRVIREFLHQRFPDHRFIGEESIDETPSGSPTSEFCWIVDPLDGTTNYIHQLPSFAVSVAVYQNQTALAGAVFDPLVDECFSAANGQGAKRNGTSIQTSPCHELEKSLLIVSFNRGVQRQDPEVTRFLNVLETAGSVRRLGSAALNLCYVACGRADGYWATSLSQWDVAAGWLIAVEAGACLADFSGAPLDLLKPHFCVTSTQELYNQLLPQLTV